MGMAVLFALVHFYPRPPSGGRPRHRVPQPCALCISIHALRVEGDHSNFEHTKDAITISIHALRVEGDRAAGLSFINFLAFLSTPSEWRATHHEYK